MNIVEKNKKKIIQLLDLAKNQLAGIDSVSIEINSSFDIVSILSYILDNKWPSAVDPIHIANPNSEDDQKERAHGLISAVIGKAIKGKFLDFGCGDGYCVAEVANAGTTSVGYDIINKGWTRFPEKDNMKLTTSWEEVVSRGPYNTILIYDVLDHVKDEDEAIEELKRLKEVLSPSGTMFVRFHPWCSRHGTHLYLSINKAYIHLCLDQEALEKLGHKEIHTIKLIHPMDTYKKWFALTGFKIEEETIIPQSVEPFFKESFIADLIKKHWNNSSYPELASGEKFPEWQTRLQFVDYKISQV